MSIFKSCCVAWGCLVLLGASLAGAPTPATAAHQDEAAGVGRDVYLRNCASCHGDAATGYGPAARSLRQRPNDLTVFSNRTRPFDRQSVRSSITGQLRFESPHETGEMPRWREALDTAISIAGGSVTELDALLTYLETIQRQPYAQEQETRTEASASAGAPLFASLCAACHGADGRGGTPDLTTMAARNGGQIDFRTLYESIARRDHADSGMPLWDRALSKAGWPAALVAKNLEALARYVESIQRQ